VEPLLLGMAVGNLFCSFPCSVTERGYTRFQYCSKAESGPTASSAEARDKQDRSQR
jgi:hypothetical protein